MPGPLELGQNVSQTAGISLYLTSEIFYTPLRASVRGERVIAPLPKSPNRVTTARQLSA